MTPEREAEIRKRAESAIHKNTMHAGDIPDLMVKIEQLREQISAERTSRMLRTAQHVEAWQGNRINDP